MISFVFLIILNRLLGTEHPAWRRSKTKKPRKRSACASSAAARPWSRRRRSNENAGSACWEFGVGRVDLEL